MASSSTLVFATQPILGVDLDSKASTPAHAALTAVWANDGRKHIYLKANGTLGSTANCTVGASGSAVSAASAGVANSYVINTTGGVVTGQYFWAKSNVV
jgi:hypothetical protein